VDQGQFIDPDFISGTHQRENFQLPDSWFASFAGYQDGGVKPKTLKLVFVASPLSIQHSGERAKTGCPEWSDMSTCELSVFV
jgi:hypothetical protein